MDYKNSRQILSENLYRLMKSNDVSQLELAQKIGVTQPTISNWLKETRYPHINTIDKLIDFFNVPKSELTERQDVDYTQQISETLSISIEDLSDKEIKEVQEFISHIKSKRT